jgi:hypothetical protein
MGIFIGGFFHPVFSSNTLQKGDKPMADEKYESYCLKCKSKQLMKDAEKTVLKNGANAVKGKCTVCGTTVMKILPKDKK